jgi:heme/copper-type cytochrome/quinol oxidase subunit 1
VPQAVPHGVTVLVVKRLAVLGLLLGALNAVAAVAVLYAVELAAPDEFGWFAYSPLNENVVYDSYGFAWEYLALPAVLVALNAVLLPLAVRLGWLRR